MTRDALRCAARYAACVAEQTCAWCYVDVPSGRRLCTSCARKNNDRAKARYHAKKAASQMKSKDKR